MRRTLLFVVVVLLFLLALPGGAGANGVLCGSVLSASVSLTEDLYCPDAGENAILIEGNGVTLDLNGYSIAGSGVSGIRIKGQDATVTNSLPDSGVITGFEYGVVLDGWAWTNAGQDQAATIDGLTLVGNGRGVLLAVSDGNAIVSNQISNSIADAIQLGVSSGNTISGNTISKNGFGVAVANGSDDNHLSGNEISKNANFGIAIFCDSDGNEVVGNAVTKTSGGKAHGIIVRLGSDDTAITGNSSNINGGDGIHVDRALGCGDPPMPSGAVIAGNTANRNGDDGIDNESPDAFISGNTTNVNSDLGIVSCSPDGGGNVAKRNGDEQQSAWEVCPLPSSPGS